MTSSQGLSPFGVRGPVPEQPPVSRKWHDGVGGGGGGDGDGDGGIGFSANGSVQTSNPAGSMPPPPATTSSMPLSAAPAPEGGPTLGS